MQLTSEKLVSQFIQCSRVGIPLVGISSADQRETASKLINSLDETESEGFSLLVWNCIDGLKSASPLFTNKQSPSAAKSNEAFAALAKEFAGEEDINDISVLPTFEILMNRVKNRLPKRSIVFVYNAHMFFDSTNSASDLQGNIQSLCNLRVPFKQNRRQIVLLSPEFKCPNELKDEIVIFDDPLPNEEKLMLLIDKVEKSIKSKIDHGFKVQCVDAVLGLSLFSAEQAFFLSLKKESDSKVSIDLDTLKHNKRTLISQTPGLRIADNKFDFNDIGGVPVIKKFMSEVIHGRKPPKLIVFIDEIEKALAGSNSNVGDNTGVSQDILGQMLQHMENDGARGVIFVGPPGTSETMVAKAVGKEAGIDTVEFDLGGVKQGEVGASEKNIRRALKVIGSCSRGSSYWIATSNNLSVIPPELRRRFTDGVFFFDLPSKEEREKIWNIHIKAYNLDKKQYKDKPNDEDWTGAEIRNCCSMAWDRNKTIQDAATFINPVAVSSAALIERLRKDASKKFLSASQIGPYIYSSGNNNPDDEDKLRTLEI